MSDTASYMSDNFDSVLEMETSCFITVKYDSNHLNLVQAFLKKWWVESDFKAPNLPFSLRLKVSGCHYNSIYNNT
jgi:hypothetical protein